MQTPYNPISGTVYSGMNIGFLMSASKCLEWATFLQWKQAGYKVKRGEHGQTIRTFVEADVRDQQTGKLKGGHVPRYYKVFNREQVEPISETPSN